MKNPARHRSCRLLVAAFFGLCLGLAARAQSLTYLMKIDSPAIQGLSVLEGYANQIEVVSYSLGGFNPVTNSTGGLAGLQSGGFQFSGLECVLALDGKAYPLLLTKMATGADLGEIILTGVSLQGETRREFFKLEMKDAKIENMSQQGTNGDQPIISIGFRPSAVRITTTYVNANGSPSDPVVFTWNLVTQTPTY